MGMVQGHRVGPRRLLLYNEALAPCCVGVFLQKRFRRLMAGMTATDV